MKQPTAVARLKEVAGDRPFHAAALLKLIKKQNPGVNFVQDRFDAAKFLIKNKADWTSVKRDLIEYEGFKADGVQKDAIRIRYNLKKGASVISFCFHTKDKYYYIFFPS